jgi:hypothetical protein
VFGSGGFGLVECEDETDELARRFSTPIHRTLSVLFVFTYEPDGGLVTAKFGHVLFEEISLRFHWIFQ